MVSEKYGQPTDKTPLELQRLHFQATNATGERRAYAHDRGRVAHRPPAAARQRPAGLKEFRGSIRAFKSWQFEAERDQRDVRRGAGADAERRRHDAERIRAAHERAAPDQLDQAFANAERIKVEYALAQE